MEYKGFSDLGSYLKYKRKEIANAEGKKFTQQDAAERIGEGLAQPVYSTFEQNKAIPTRYYKRLSEVFDVPVEVIEEFGKIKIEESLSSSNPTTEVVSNIDENTKNKPETIVNKPQNKSIPSNIGVSVDHLAKELQDFIKELVNDEERLINIYLEEKRKQLLSK